MYPKALKNRMVTNTPVFQVLSPKGSITPSFYVDIIPVQTTEVWGWCSQKKSFGQKKWPSNWKKVFTQFRPRLWSEFNPYIMAPLPPINPSSTLPLLGTNSFPVPFLDNLYITIPSPHTYIICRRVLYTSSNSREPAPLSPSPPWSWRAEINHRV